MNPHKERIDWTLRDKVLLAMYWTFVSHKGIATALGVGQSSVYRRLRQLKVKPRYANRNGRNYMTPITPYKKGHPLVRQMFREARQQRIGSRELADHVGVTTSALTTWNRGGCPAIKNLEKAGRLVGLKLEWSEIDG